MQHHPALATSPHPLPRPCVACRVGSICAPRRHHPHPSALFLHLHSWRPRSHPLHYPGPQTLHHPHAYCSPSGRALARPTCPPSRPLASSTRKSSFAEFYVSLLKWPCALTPTRGITVSAPRGRHHANTPLSNAIAASTVHRRWATRLPVRPRIGVSPGIEPFDPALPEVRAPAPSAGGATARLLCPLTFAQGRTSELLACSRYWAPPTVSLAARRPPPCVGRNDHDYRYTPGIVPPDPAQPEARAPAPSAGGATMQLSIAPTFAGGGTPVNTLTYPRHRAPPTASLAARLPMAGITTAPRVQTRSRQAPFIGTRPHGPLHGIGVDPRYHALLR